MTATNLDAQVTQAIAEVRAAGEAAAAALDRLAAAAAVDLAGLSTGAQASTSSRAQLVAAWREWREAEHAEVVARDVLAELLSSQLHPRGARAVVPGELSGQVRHCDRPMSKESTRFTSRDGKAFTTIELRCAVCAAMVTLDLVEPAATIGGWTEEPPTIPNLKQATRRAGSADNASAQPGENPRARRAGGRRQAV